MIVSLKGESVLKPILCDYMEKEDYGDLRERNGIEKGREEGREEGIEKGIEGSVKLLRDCGIPDSEIVMKIMNQYNLTLDKAQSYLRFI